ncbi:hypothetical protein DXG01_014606 [Tephrocybe rancida]|nr:hypothetical protein DXG01_014606 [Tephrocybe rancida]
MVVSLADMSRPHRQGLNTPSYLLSDPYDTFGIPLLYSHASEESETGGGGGPYGQPATPGMADSYGGHPTVSGAQYLPQPQQRDQRTSRGHRFAPDHGPDNFDFSALPTGQPVGYQQPQGAVGIYAPQGHGSQQPQLYYGNEHRTSWNEHDMHNQQQRRVDHSRGTVPEILSAGPDLHRRGGSRESMSNQEFRHGHPHGAFEMHNQRNIYSSHARPTTYPPSPAHSAGSNSNSPAIKADSPRSISLALPNESPHHQPIEDWLRENSGIRNGADISLWSLPNPPSPTQRPNVTYKVLVSLAIYGSPNRRLSLQEIYNEIERRFPYYKNLPEEIGRDGKSGGKKWQRSVRHNLSLESIFQNEGRLINEPGKGGYWHITNRNGYGQKRERKRKGKSSSSSTSSRESYGKTEDDDDMDDDDDDDDISEESQVGSSSGAHRTGRSSRHNYSSNTSFPVLSNTLMPFDSVPTFGQPSLGGHSTRSRQQAPRTSSTPQLPNMNMVDPNGRPNPTRPSTVPLYVGHGTGHGYEDIAGPEQQYRLGGQQQDYSFGLGESDEGLRRSQRGDRGRRREY